MRGKLLLATAAALLLVGCMAERPIHERVTLDFQHPGHVNVTEATTIEDVPSLPLRFSMRVEAFRDVLANGRDEWSNRFARLNDATDRVTFYRRAGLVWRVEHAVTMDRDTLPKLFADMPITIQARSDGGWGEVDIFPESSMRASRQQREHFEKSLDAWSHAVARYFESMRHLYAYLDANPQRAKVMFAQILTPPIDAPPEVSDREQKLLDRTSEAAAKILTMIDEAEEHRFTLQDEADLLYNPLRAEFTIRVPGEVLEVEGFEKSGDGTYRFVAPTLLDVVASLEGRWLSPDPLAMKIRALHVPDTPPPDLDALAAAPRRVAPVITPNEIAAAVTEQLHPPATFRVRWVE